MPSLSYQIIIYLTLTICALSIYAQSSEPTPSDENQGSNAINQALVPFYSLADGFLRAVFPQGLRPDTIKKITDTIGNSSVTTDQIWPLTQTILNGYYGFATCFVVGILLVIIMPFVGCFCCCCRSCGKCGGKNPEQDPSNAKCKKLLCAGLLLVFTLITVGGMVLAFFSAAELHNLVQSGTIEQNLTDSFENINHTAYRAINDDIVGQTTQILDDLEKDVARFVDDAGVKLTGNFLNLTHVEGPVSNLADVLDLFNRTLDELVISLQALQDNIDETHMNYSEAADLSRGTTCLGCAQLTAQIDSMVGDVADLSQQANTNQTIDDINNGAKRRLNSVPNLRVVYHEVNGTVFDKVEEHLNASKDEINAKVVEATRNVRSQVQSLSSQVLGMLSNYVQEATNAVQSATSSEQSSNSPVTVEQGSTYVWYVNVALASVIAFILLLYLVGLMCGCGDRPGPDANCCNKGCGANFLLAAIGFTFIFYSLLMLFTTLSFSVGSLLSSQVCRTIQEPSTTTELLRNNDFYIPNSNVSAYGILKSYSDCLNRGTIDGVLSSLDAGFGKQDLLNLVETYVGQEQVDQIIDGVTIPTGQFQFLPADFNHTLYEMLRYEGLNSSIVPNVTGQVDGIKANLSLLIAAVEFTKLTTTESGRADLTRIQDIFRASRDSGVDLMAGYANEILQHVMVLEANFENLQNATHDVLDTIMEAQNDLVQNGETKMKEALRVLGSQLVEEIAEDAAQGIDRILGGDCYDLADSLRQTADVFCDTLLHPFNGLWFSMGWCLIMFIPCIIIALCVTSLFRRELPYEGDYKEDLNRDYDRDNIPLESRNRPVYQHYGDVSNQAFRDDYGHALRGGGLEKHNGGSYNGHNVGYY